MTLLRDDQRPNWISPALYWVMEIQSEDDVPLRFLIQPGNPENRENVYPKPSSARSRSYHCTRLASMKAHSIWSCGRRSAN